MVSQLLGAASNKVRKGLFQPRTEVSRISRLPAKGEQSPVILERAAGSALRLSFGSCFIVTHDTEIKGLGTLWNNRSFPCPVVK